MLSPDARRLLSRMVRDEWLSPFYFWNSELAAADELLDYGLIKRWGARLAVLTPLGMLLGKRGDEDA